MGSVLSTVQSSILEQNRTILFSSLLVGGVVTIISIILFASSPSYVKAMVKRFVRIQIRKRLMDPYMNGSDTGAFVSYYRSILCNLEQINNELLGNILKNNHSCAFFIDRSISFLSSHRPSSVEEIEEGYTSIDEFRQKVPLTTYDDYRNYIDRMILEGEKNQLIPDKINYFVLSSGTTGKFKAVPLTTKLMRELFTITRSAPSVIWRSLPSSSYPAPEQRSFVLLSGKKAEMFPKSKNGTPMGPLSQILSAVPFFPGMRLVASSNNVIGIDLIERMPDFHTNAFVQLVFALSIPNIFSYAVPFASEFVHTIKIIESHFEEMSICIASASFDHSSLVQNKIHDTKLITALNRALNETIIEYGGATYRLERAEQIRKACLENDVPGLLHRLWPSLVYVCTAIGGGFSMYKESLRFYCGEKLPISNLTFYSASEGLFGTIASIHTDEYFLSPSTAFFEFIKEEDVHQTQPKTLLISEIEPGNRYELVCTTESGLVRYRMGDIINCTRFLSRAENLVPLPMEPVEIPRIPLISIGYRVGNLLDVFGEKTTEQNLIDALKQTVDDWKEQGIFVDICDFTCYSKLDAFPPHYIIFLELTDEQRYNITEQQLRILQNTVNAAVEQHLCKLNYVYERVRSCGFLGSPVCAFVRRGTFSTFVHEKLLTDRVSPIQVKPHRLLKNEQHIQFFHLNCYSSISHNNDDRGHC